MNKKVILFLTLFLIVVSCGCSNKGKSDVASLNDDYNTQSKDTEQQMVVALNPQITYSDGEAYHAFADISSKLINDLNEDTMTLYRETCWRWMYYNEGTAEWVERDAVSKGVWQNYKQENTAKTLYSYSFTTDGTTALTPYDTKSVHLLSYAVNAESKQGVMMSVTGENEEGLHFIAPKDGKVTLSDPTGGNISILRRVSGMLTSSLDNDDYDRFATVIIYHNGEPIWSRDFYNPKHVKTMTESDGVYYAKFPELKDMTVKEGDLISIVVENNTEMRTPLKMLWDEYKEYVEVSEVVLDEGGNYISVQGKPYLMTGIQIKPHLIANDMSAVTDEQLNECYDMIFKQCVEMGYKTVIFPANWSEIEMIEGKYSFVILERLYKYAEKYDLTVQLLWFGSDSCGHDTNMPNYILNDTVKYSRLAEYPKVIDYSDMDMVEREMLVFGKLLDWLYEYDTERRTVMIQIENEPNFEAAYGPKNTNATDIESIEATKWCAGQKKEIWNIMNALGMMVKTGPYRCVTRVNLATGQYYYNGVLNEEPSQVAALEGIDIVGFDSYQPNEDPYLLDYLKFEGNIPHWPEFGATGSNYLPATLHALSKRAGSLAYQLKATQGDQNGIIQTIGDDWTWPTGGKIENSTLEYSVDAYEVKALNTVLNKASEQFAVNDVTKSQVFNPTRATACNETAEINGVKVTFANSGNNDFGGCGYATAVSDNEMLIFATRGNSSFHFAGKNVASVQSGSYVDGTWKTEQELPISGNAVSISSDMAKAGTLIRVTFN